MKIGKEKLTEEQKETPWDTKVELIPEAIVAEAEPIGYARAPVSKKGCGLMLELAFP